MHAKEFESLEGSSNTFKMGKIRKLTLMKCKKLNEEFNI